MCKRVIACTPSWPTKGQNSAWLVTAKEGRVRHLTQLKPLLVMVNLGSILAGLSLEQPSQGQSYIHTNRRHCHARHLLKRHNRSPDLPCLGCSKLASCSACPICRPCTASSCWGIVAQCSNKLPACAVQHSGRSQAAMHSADPSPTPVCRHCNASTFWRGPSLAQPLTPTPWEQVTPQQRTWGA